MPRMILLCLVGCLLSGWAQAQTANAVSPGEFIVEPATLLNLGFEWKISGDGNRNATVTVQYRKVGTELWQAVDKSTEKVIEFTPPVTTPGVPEKFEFRGIYILKNQRVGQWSPIYTETVG